MSRAKRDPLLPILRSEAQAKILSALFLGSDDDPLHIRLIADRTDLPFSTVQREIDRLEEAGLVRSQRFAQARVVRPNEHSPIAGDLRTLLLKAYGPAVVVGDLLSQVAGVQEAYIFGSWAARYEGEVGPLPGDIDVLIVGTPDVDLVHDALADAEERLGREVQPAIVSPEEWRSARSGLLRTIRDRPRVRLDVGQE